jgi:hypothetical protein
MIIGRRDQALGQIRASLCSLGSLLFTLDKCLLGRDRMQPKTSVKHRKGTHRNLARHSVVEPKIARLWIDYAGSALLLVRTLQPVKPLSGLLITASP